MSRLSVMYRCKAFWYISSTFTPIMGEPLTYLSCCCFAVAEGNVWDRLRHRGLTRAGIFRAGCIACRGNFLRWWYWLYRVWLRTWLYCGYAHGRWCGRTGWRWFRWRCGYGKGWRQWRGARWRGARWRGARWGGGGWGWGWWQRTSDNWPGRDGKYIG